jgi:hypothetical protein
VCLGLALLQQFTVQQLGLAPFSLRNQVVGLEERARSSQLVVIKYDKTPELVVLKYYKTCDAVCFQQLVKTSFILGAAKMPENTSESEKEA